MSLTHEESKELELLEKHKGLVKFVVRGFRNCGINEQDLFQEGLIALFKAVQTFKAENNIKFETYASRVIKNRLIDLVRREKETTGALSDQATSGATIEDEFSIIEKSEMIKQVLDKECTPIEKAVFNSYALGHSYDEISKIFDITKKKIDNTIQKVRGKIRGSL